MRRAQFHTPPVEEEDCVLALPPGNGAPPPQIVVGGVSLVPVGSDPDHDRGSKNGQNWHCTYYGRSLHQRGDCYQRSPDYGDRDDDFDGNGTDKDCTDCTQYCTEIGCMFPFFEKRGQNDTKSA